MENKKVCLDVETFLKVEELLEQIPRERMIEMGDELNGYDCWPAELEEVPSEKREACRTELIGMIESRVGRRALLRHHHIHNMHRTEQEFEDWWEERGAWWLWDGEAAEDLKDLITDALAEYDRECAENELGKRAVRKKEERMGMIFLAVIVGISFVLGLGLAALM